MDGEVGSNMSFEDALNFAFKRIKKANTTMNDLRLVKDAVIAAAKKLGYEDYAISNITKKHLIYILEKCSHLKIRDKNKYKEGGAFSNNKFNKNRTYLMMLYDELEQMEIADKSVVEKIVIKPKVKKLTKVLSADQRKQVDKMLKEKYYSFWRLLHIFFHSGAREREIMDVKKEDVDLKKQMVKYLFSKGLMPGDGRIRTDQLQKRWRRLVKVPLGIEAGFYSLKHLNSMETATITNQKIAARLNQHTEKVLKNHYDLSADEREIALIKKLPNTFA